MAANSSIGSGGAALGEGAAGVPGFCAVFMGGEAAAAGRLSVAGSGSGEDARGVRYA